MAAANTFWITSSECRTTMVEKAKETLWKQQQHGKEDSSAKAATLVKKP